MWGGGGGKGGRRVLSLTPPDGCGDKRRERVERERNNCRGKNFINTRLYI